MKQLPTGNLKTSFQSTRTLRRPKLRIESSESIMFIHRRHSLREVQLRQRAILQRRRSSWLNKPPRFNTWQQLTSSCKERTLIFIATKTRCYFLISLHTKHMRILIQCKSRSSTLISIAGMWAPMSSTSDKTSSIRLVTNQLQAKVKQIRQPIHVIRLLMKELKAKTGAKLPLTRHQLSPLLDLLRLMVDSAQV